MPDSPKVWPNDVWLTLIVLTVRSTGLVSTQMAMLLPIDLLLCVSSYRLLSLPLEILLKQGVARSFCQSNNLRREGSEMVDPEGRRPGAMGGADDSFALVILCRVICTSEGICPSISLRCSSSEEQKYLSLFFWTHVKMPLRVQTPMYSVIACDHTHELMGSARDSISDVV
jgi:hypothetical protein